MATKMCFLVDEKNIFLEEIISFEYVKGLVFSQKQKNVLSFHKSIKELYPDKKIMEISTKSFDEIGVRCSAFNLKLNGYYFESVFQSSKVFEGNVRYDYLKYRLPKEAKQFINDTEHGDLKYFEYNNQIFPLEPKSIFYDYLYIQALIAMNIKDDELLNSDIFTDIEFNEKKQYNCQARAMCIYVSLIRQNLLEEAMKDLESFNRIVYTNYGYRQLSMKLE